MLTRDILVAGYSYASDVVQDYNQIVILYTENTTFRWAKYF